MHGWETIPVQTGFLYLLAVMGWATRRVLSWRLSNTLDARFCPQMVIKCLKAPLLGLVSVLQILIRPFQ